MKNPTWQHNEGAPVGRVKIERRHKKETEAYVDGVKQEEHVPSVDMKKFNIYSKTFFR